MAHTGNPKGYLCTKMVSLPETRPAFLRAGMITISAHLRHIPLTPVLIYIIPGGDASGLFGNVPRKRDSTPLPELNFSSGYFLRFCHLNSSQRSLISNHILA